MKKLLAATMILTLALVSICGPSALAESTNWYCYGTFSTDYIVDNSNEILCDIAASMAKDNICSVAPALAFGIPTVGPWLSAIITNLCTAADLIDFINKLGGVREVTLYFSDDGEIAIVPVTETDLYNSNWA
jgi:hypothetical protein